jgi:hypothetical protein
MMGQSNTENLRVLSGELQDLTNRIDAAARRVMRRDEIMAKLLSGEITAKQAAGMMQEADR